MDPVVPMTTEERAYTSPHLVHAIALRERVLDDVPGAFRSAVQGEGYSSQGAR